MKNDSPFKGVKELGEFQFHVSGRFWKVFEFEMSSHAWIFVGNIRKIGKESNFDLYHRAKESLMALNDASYG